MFEICIFSGVGGNKYYSRIDSDVYFSCIAQINMTRLSNVTA